VAEKFKSAVEALRIAHDTSKAAGYVTISQGCASCVPGRDNESSSLIGVADGALYQSKQNGRNRVNIVSLSTFKPSVG
jgi:diguanylate cyclase (GGDEF)-like protein